MNKESLMDAEQGDHCTPKYGCKIPETQVRDDISPHGQRSSVQLRAPKGTTRQQLS